MARIYVQAQNREITDVAEIRDFLKPCGIWYEHWDVAGRVGSNATDQEILDAYSPEIERLKAQGGYVTADVINVNPQTPNLDSMLAKFDKEHTHSEDEVRFTVAGSGLFHIHPDSGPVFSITVESGDLINVPRGTKHWFNLCATRTIRCIRLFEDKAGWTPNYVENSRHVDHPPICFGPQYLARGPEGKLASVVDV
jgi:1,2-dihydroxy-3-keto-5-methylthiopentene dioxygenase